ncbi:MAG TPA: GntR family transcriptional regulator [Arthrobacter bacterium]|nr:GntR family transcriptional regulator [Arthrobacter sp.]HAP89989.1 GntR family transcriptional regulator [Arthrobacter sp.]HBH57354.1 GntR family transcriptional regulator [Arthrobacter sp.]HCB57448.1 GntR family transcriptional regulator [Arthrobacter sp.]HCC40605.1 GntR family transcriptional regulator [Arthrobacter sp.]
MAASEPHVRSSSPSPRESTNDTAKRSAAGRLRVAVPSVAERVADELRLQLAEGALLPGARLTESTIAEDLGVSRNTVREAFAELASERLVVRHPNRGVFVASLEAGDVHDVYTVRRAIEVSALRGGGSPEDVAAVRAAVEEGRRAAAAGDDEALGTANQHFHRAIVAMAGSPRLNSIMGQVLAEMRLFFHKATLDADFYQHYLPDNEAICLALESGELDRAADLLLAYLDRSEDNLSEVHGETETD